MFFLVYFFCRRDLKNLYRHLCLCPYSPGFILFRGNRFYTTSTFLSWSTYSSALTCIPMLSILLRSYCGGIGFYMWYITIIKSSINIRLIHLLILNFSLISFNNILSKRLLWYCLYKAKGLFDSFIHLFFDTNIVWFIYSLFDTFVKGKIIIFQF